MQEWNGMEWNGMEWNGMEWNGMEWWNEIRKMRNLTPDPYFLRIKSSEEGIAILFTPQDQLAYRSSYDI